ncbi:sugar phosphate isomerase/epimerase [Kitasatospora paranensis]|uniref:sugar phosphate isomerase/epimerase family protein n=1 Tax=Kitasatospora paranensis TaxID=258053 RepID=UPI0031E6ACC5
MRLALSTLGLPGRPLGEALRLAADHGWQGVELRCAPGESVHPALTATERRRAAAELTAHEITPLALASYVGVARPGEDAAVAAELAHHLRLAADLGAHWLRVFPQGGAGAEGAEADGRAVRRLASAAGLAEALGVRIALETHDSHRSGRAVGRVLTAVGHRSVGAIWDVLHTWLAGESPAATRDALAAHPGYLQVKDVAGADDLTPLPLGAGVLPLADCLAGLPGDGWVSWEYEAPWHPAAAPLPPLLGPGARHLRCLA